MSDFDNDELSALSVEPKTGHKLKNFRVLIATKQEIFFKSNITIRFRI